MRSLNDLPVKSKLTIIIMLTSGAALVIACGVFITCEVQSRRQEMRQRLHILAEVVGANCSASLAFNDARAAEEMLETLRIQEPIDEAAIYDRDGAPFARYVRSDRDGSRTDRPLEPDGARFARGHLIQVSPIILDGERVGSVLLSSNLQDLDASMRRDGAVALGVLGLCLIVSFALSSRLRRLISGPLDGLARTARAVAENKDFSLRAVTRNRDDIGRLIDDFNGMLTQIQTRDAALLKAREGLERRVEERTAELLQEIAENKRTQDELKQARIAAEAASQAKSEFLANMSHEIRTPMNGIMGMTDIVLGSRLSAEQRRHLGIVKGSADALLTILNDILDFSKIEAGKLDIDSVEFALRATLDNAMKALSPQAHAKGIELSYHVQPEIPDALVGDPGRLRQVLTNLVGNAIKFTAHGEVAVRVELESPPADAPRLHFAIRDTGIGIDPAKLELIFAPFTQADGTTTRRYGGTGLGLTISSQLVGMMGGRIWVESAKGAGSTFHFTTALTRQAGEPAPEAPRVKLKGLRALVVDDNATNREILHEMLTVWEVDVVLADGHAAAMQAVQGAKRSGRAIALVLLDASMPEMDGFALAAKLRRETSHSKMTIMMLTSAGQRGDAARCRKLGIAAYLTKPISQSDLLDAIVAAFGAAAPRARAAPLVTRHSLREKRRRYTILLAEDNAVNQAVALRTLEKAGHAVVIANNGKEALALIESRPFDLVLMDVQMPEMGGFEATKVVRASEAGHARHLPIIAMTAHAMKGDRELCLQAGMDAYVSKPVDPVEMFSTIERVMGGPPVPAARALPSIPNMEEEMGIILARFGGDLGLLATTAKAFLDSYASMMRDIQAAVGSRDPAALGRSAHVFKGAIGNFVTHGAFAAAQRLETMGRKGDLSRAPAEFRELEREVALLAGILSRSQKVDAA